MRRLLIHHNIEIGGGGRLPELIQSCVSNILSTYRIVVSSILCFCVQIFMAAYMIMYGSVYNRTCSMNNPIRPDMIIHAAFIYSGKTHFYFNSFRMVGAAVLRPYVCKHLRMYVCNGADINLLRGRFVLQRNQALRGGFHFTGWPCVADYDHASV